MDAEKLKIIAGQLRQPNGENGIKVGENMNKGNFHINMNTIEALKLADNENILEIGMGNGFFVKDILAVANSITYTGCDFSKTMIGEAINNNQKFIDRGQVKFLTGSADNLPFANEEFDKVFTINTIYFWENHQLVLSEIWRVLKPKGQIFISLRPKSVMQYYPYVKYGFKMFSKEDLTNLLSQNNFKIINTINKEEPDREIDGEMFKVETLIICAEKI